MHSSVRIECIRYAIMFLVFVSICVQIPVKCATRVKKDRKEVLVLGNG